MFRNLIEAKTGLILWSDTDELRAHRIDYWQMIVKEVKDLQGLYSHVVVVVT